MRNSIFYLGMGCLFTHELDAMANSEWRILPLLRSLPDGLAMATFVVVHIPLFAIVIALIASKSDRMRRLSRLGVSGFLVLHGLLHLLFSSDPGYEFNSALSNALIFGGVLLGATYLLFSREDIRSLTAR